MKTKVCSKCQEEKTLDAFYVDNRVPSGRQAACKECQRRGRKIKKEVSAQQDWNRRNPDKALNSNLKSKYGITLDEYNAMLEAQGRACGICKKIPHYRLCVDHCHKTNVVRGLLCKRCNTLIALLDNEELKSSAEEYLDKATKLWEETCQEQ